MTARRFLTDRRANFPFQICTEACGTTHRQHRHRKLRLGILSIMLCISLMSAEVSDACAQSTGRRKFGSVVVQDVILESGSVVGLLSQEVPNKHRLVELADRQASQLGVCNRICIFIDFCNLVVSNDELEDVHVVISSAILGDVVTP